MPESNEQTVNPQKKSDASPAPVTEPDSIPPIHVDLGVDLPRGESIRVTIESLAGGAQPVTVRQETIRPFEYPSPMVETGTVRPVRPAETQHRTSSAASILATLRRASSRLRHIPLGPTLLLLALGLYLASRLIGLTQWPMYFFTDETVQQNFAAELVKGGGVWHDGTYLPTFFENAGQYEMNFSVYVQVIPYMIFGKSEFVTRGVSVFVTLFGALAVGLVIQKAFRLPYVWAGVLFFSIIPAWFLHSRTAFESAEAVSLFALFLLFYWLYRSESPGYLFPCLFFGALCAYTYSPAQLVMLVAGVLLLLSDIRYHIKNWRFALGGLAFLILLSIPYDIFLVQHPTGNQQQLSILNSYWIRDTSVWEKLKIYFGNYLQGFNPGYWFLPEQEPIARHLMKGYGHVFTGFAPLAAIGFLLTLWNIRDARFRVILAAMLAAPAGAALVGITITRTLFMVVPIAILITLGCVFLLALITRPSDWQMPEYLSVWRTRFSAFLAMFPAWREAHPANSDSSTANKSLTGGWQAWKGKANELTGRFSNIGLPFVAVAIALFVILAAVNVYMTWDALTNGATWYTDYGLYGMQYGGPQLTSAMMDYVKKNPGTEFVVSPDWANGTDEIMNFFLPENFPYRMDGIDSYINQIQKIAPDEVNILTPEEYTRAQQSGLFADLRTLETLPWPDGRPGFYFLQLQYAADASQIMENQKEALAKPVEEIISLNKESVRVSHSRLDMGSLADGFDDDPVSLMRGLSANPLFVEMFFPKQRTFTSIHALVGAAPTRLTVIFYPQDGSASQSFSAEVARDTENHVVAVTLPQPITTDHIRLEFLVIGEDEPAHVHVYNISLEGNGWKSALDAPGS